MFLSHNHVEARFSQDEIPPASEKSSRREFFYSARTQHENLGDAIINRELLAQIRQKGRVHVFDGRMPPAYLRILNLTKSETYKSLSTFVINLILSGIDFRKSTYLVLNPGGFSGNLSWQGTLIGACQLLSYMSFCLIGVRIVRLGYSAERFTPARQRLERWKSAFMHRAGLRDHRSLSYSRGFGLQKADLCPDFAFMLPAEENSLPRRGAVISLRMDQTDQATLDCLETVVGSLDLVLPKVTVIAQVKFDTAHVARIAAHLGPIAEAVSQELDEAEACWLYRSAEYVISNRLHVLLLALRCGATPVALIDPERNAKILGIYEDNGLERLVVKKGTGRAVIERLDQGQARAIFERNAALIRAEIDRL